MYVIKKSCRGPLLIQIQDLLEAKRNLIHKQLDSILSVQYNSEDCSCGFKSKSAYSYLGQLSGEGLLPSLYLDLETALNRVKKAEQMGPPNEVEDSTACENYRWHTPAYSRETVLKNLQGLKDGKGLCLNCISGGSRVYSETPCSIKH